MDSLTLAHAIEHAKTALTLARDRLWTEGPTDERSSPGREEAERRVRAEVARLAELLERANTAVVAAATLETVADELDEDLAVLDEILAADGRVE
jgi:hypothetical protein